MPVVLKVVKQIGDEWHSGAMVDAFEGRGVFRLYEFTEGAALLERLVPGTSLVDLSVRNGDQRATEILADVIGRMSPRSAPSACPKVADWGKGFDWYLGSGDTQIRRHPVVEAQRIYLKLCATQRTVRLLHGDLQHYNVRFDAKRGWLAIDPKGVIGEVEYEVGAFLRNPFERPDLFTNPSIIDRRVTALAADLNLDRDRVIAWAYAQAVLSAVWMIEDGAAVTEMDPVLSLATTCRSLLSDEP